MPRHREQPSPGVLLIAVAGELRRAVGHYPREVGQRLDVVHHRRLHVEAPGGREERGLQAGHAAVALERLDECGLLADDVRAGAPVQHHVHREVGAEDVLADVAGGVRLVQRSRDALVRVGHLAADVKEHLLGLDRIRADQGAFDELMRIALHQEAVLEGAGLGLVAVDDEVTGEHVRRQKTPLRAAREAGSAAAGQVGRLHFGDDLVRSAGEGRLQCRVATGAQVAVERMPVSLVQAGRDHLQGRRHQMVSLLARRSDGMDWRTLPSDPWLGMSARLPFRSSATSESKPSWVIRSK